jgi:hypothetical protein
MKNLPARNKYIDVGFSSVIYQRFSSYYVRGALCKECESHYA